MLARISSHHCHRDRGVSSHTGGMTTSTGIRLGPSIPHPPPSHARPLISSHPSGWGCFIWRRWYDNLCCGPGRPIGPPSIFFPHRLTNLQVVPRPQNFGNPRDVIQNCGLAFDDCQIFLFCRKPPLHAFFVGLPKSPISSCSTS